MPHAFGTVRYSSPEMAAHSAGPASDVWSVGVVLCQVLTGRVPFLKDNDVETLAYIKKGPEVRCCRRRRVRMAHSVYDLFLMPASLGVWWHAVSSLSEQAFSCQVASASSIVAHHGCLLHDIHIHAKHKPALSSPSPC